MEESFAYASPLEDTPSIIVFLTKRLTHPVCTDHAVHSTPPIRREGVCCKLPVACAYCGGTMVILERCSAFVNGFSLSHMAAADSHCSKLNSQRSLYLIRP
eukprot:6209145-Pleurochrysis_carterae.AAC.2